MLEMFVLAVGTKYFFNFINGLLSALVSHAILKGSKVKTIFNNNSDPNIVNEPLNSN